MSGEAKHYALFNEPLLDKQQINVIYKFTLHTGAIVSSFVGSGTLGIKFGSPDSPFFYILSVLEATLIHRACIYIQLANVALC